MHSCRQSTLRQTLDATKPETWRHIKLAMVWIIYFFWKPSCYNRGMALIRSGNAGSTDSKLFVWDTDFCDGLGFHGRKNEQGKSGKFVQKKFGHFNFTKIMISNGCHPADSWRSCKTKTWFWTKMVLELGYEPVRKICQFTLSLSPSFKPSKTFWPCRHVAQILLITMENYCVRCASMWVVKSLLLLGWNQTHRSGIGCHLGGFGCQRQCFCTLEFESHFRLLG